MVFCPDGHVQLSNLLEARREARAPVRWAVRVVRRIRRSWARMRATPRDLLTLLLLTLLVRPAKVAVQMQEAIAPPPLESGLMTRMARSQQLSRVKRTQWFRRTDAALRLRNQHC